MSPPSGTSKRARICEKNALHFPRKGPELALESRNLIRETIYELNLVSPPTSKRVDLSLGDPTKFGGVFSIAEPLKKAMIDTVNSSCADGYAFALGMEKARKAIASRYESVDFNDVAITSGCSSALDITFRSLVGFGDSVLVPAPGFPLYETLLKLNDGEFIRKNIFYH